MLLFSADAFYTLQPPSLSRSRSPGFSLFLSPLLSLYFSPSQHTCAVCLEDFRVKDELGVLPCQHAFHRRQVSPHLTPSRWNLCVRCVCLCVRVYICLTELLFAPVVAWWSGWRCAVCVPCVTSTSLGHLNNATAWAHCWMNWCSGVAMPIQLEMSGVARCYEDAAGKDWCRMLLWWYDRNRLV